MRMVALQFPGFPQLLRMLALGLLFIGLLVKPVQAAACDVEDLKRVLGGEDVPAWVADGSGADDPCCPNQHCGECCASGMATLPVSTALDVPATTSRPLTPLSVEFKAPPYLVAFRPPIAI